MMMKRRICTAVVFVLLSAILIAILVPAGRAADTAAVPAAPAVDDGKAELAERFYGFGKDYLNRAQPITSADLHAAAALFREAERLNPLEPRFPRLAYEALEQAQDYDGALAEVQAYENAYAKMYKGDHDRVAEEVQVDLNLAKMQAVDKKLAYMDQILATPALSTDIRAHAAVVEAQLFQERAQPDKALEMVKEASRIDSLNIQARQMKLSLEAATEPVAQQLSDWLALLRCNPAQPVAMARVGQILAQAGLVLPSIRYLSTAQKLYGSTGMSMSEDYAQDYGAELFIAGKNQQALALLSQYNTSNPIDGGGWMVRLAVERSNDKNGSYALAQQQAETALFGTMAQYSAGMRKELATSQTPPPSVPAAPASQPSAIAMTTIADDVALMKATPGSRWQSPYMSTAVRLGWYLVYFKKDTKATQQLLDALAPLLPETDPMVQRLQGWMAFDTNDFDGARGKWTPIADSDPLAKLGIILIDLKDARTKPAAAAQARRLLSQNPSGILGAILWNALASVTGPVVPGPQSDLIQAALFQFPDDLLQIVDAPSMFFGVTLTPRTTSVDFGQPLLMDLAIRNVSTYDLTIGEDGTIHNDLWFDGQVLGEGAKAIGNITFDRLMGRHVLKKGEVLRQTVRIDEGALEALFTSKPSMLMEFQVYMTINPVRSASGTMVAGPCGLRTSTPDAITRNGTSVSQPEARQAVLEKLAGSPPTQQLRIMEFLDQSTQSLVPPPQPPGLHLQVPTTGPVDDVAWTADGRAAIDPLAASSEPVIRGSAMTALAGLPSADSTKIINDMLTDTDPIVRMLGLYGAMGFPDHGLVADQAASTDTDALAKAFAVARLEKVSTPTTQPATQPAASAPVGILSPPPTATTAPMPATTKP